MSYQIKSTPYFRRMFNNSKKNGQLQRLREEYERIQEFNDRTIELKMRQVRLKRLFREIEEIKEGGGTSSAAANRVGGGGGSPSPTSISARRRHHHHHRHQYNMLSGGTTLEQRRHHQRAEALIRSRELGKALSRRNAKMNEAGVGGFLRSALRSTAKIRAVADFRRDAQERRERAAKRISYGNDQSRQNLQRQLKVCQRRLTAKYQPQKSREIGPNRVRSGYKRITPSQLDMMVDEEDLAAEQQRYFREQVEDELQLAEERFRQQEKRLCLEVVGSSITSEEEDGQEELRFLRGEQAMSESEDDDEVNNEVKLRGFSGDHKYELTLAEEHFRLEATYSDDERKVYEVDEHEAEEQQRCRQQHAKSSHLPQGRFSVSSSAIGTTQSVLSDYHHYQAYHPASTATATVLSSDQEMATAPLANEEQITSPVAPRSIKCRTASEADDLPAINNWRRVSLMMPWFKAFNPRKSHSDSSRSLSGTIRVEQLQEQAIGEATELCMM